jgi:hypothetical protein
MNETFQIQKSRADRLRQLHSEILGACRTVLSKAIEAGGILYEVKASLPHGEFTSWVEGNAGFNIRTAQRYMKIHENRDQINDSVSLLTDAHRLLTTSKPEMEPLSADEIKLGELEAVIEKNLRILADSGLCFDDFLSFFGVTFEELFVLLKLAEDDDRDKMFLNFKEICSNLKELHIRDGWKALGYTSWQECVEKEFAKGALLKKG